jgi:hypothetical protein
VAERFCARCGFVDGRSLFTARELFEQAKAANDPERRDQLSRDALAICVDVIAARKLREATAMEVFKTGDRVRLNAVSARLCAPAHRDRLGIVTAVTTMIYVRWDGNKTGGPLHPMFLEVVPSEEALAAEKLRAIGELEYASWSAMREEANANG